MTLACYFNGSCETTYLIATAERADGCVVIFLGCTKINRLS